MSRDSEKRTFNSRRRTILYLIEKYLSECGYPEISNILKSQAYLNDYEVCDNIDIETIFLEYCSYYQLKFGKYPNLLKKLNNLEIDLKSLNPKKDLRTPKPSKDALPIQNSNNNLSDSIQVKHIDSLTTKIAQINFEMTEIPDEWKEYSDLISRSLIKKDLNFKWTDIIGNIKAVDIIKEAVILPLKSPDLFTGNIRPWKSVLLHGPPGSGKTLIAKTLCSETKDEISFFNITSSTLISKWRGDSEKILNCLFHMARTMCPSVIFFDEIECLTSKRNNSNEHEASHRLKSEFLALLDGIEDNNCGVFILANTNVPWAIDEAFLRRFEKKIFVELPSFEERKQMVNHFLNESKHWEKDSLDNLAKISEGFSGDEIRIACKEAKMMKFRNSSGKENLNLTVEEQFLNDAIKSMKPNSLKAYSNHLDWKNSISN